ncbi:MAG TPA: Rrf2 family transcriptional regulator [Alphaproteobacteria bacterium]|nr:Rrf2 family transcriptional regulator [Alphaproteobacteria bacterium]
MLRLSKKVLFAIEAVLDIAYNGGSEPVQSREITRRQGIPRRYLEQALQQLVRRGILVGIRGPKGGYRLARERRRISVGDIVRAIRGVEGAPAVLPEDEPGSELGHRIVRPLWLGMQQQALAELGKITIDDLCADADEKNIPSEGRTNLDFSI